MPLLDAVLSLLAPHDCLLCGAEGVLLCGRCSELELAPVPSRCYRCKSISADFGVCDKCRKQTSLRHVWVRTLYTDTAKLPLLAYKFERARSAHVPLARAMCSVIPLLPKDTLVISVPSTTSRIRERGYDHAKLLARDVAAHISLVQDSPVVRLGQAHQFGASRRVRLAQLQDAFLVTRSAAVKGKQILLIDDVVTTGATLEALAKILKRAGARQIDALVFAQKI